MEQNNVLKIGYTFFLGILVAIFIGMGISTFYPSPDRPEYPADLYSTSKEPTAEQEAKIRQYEEDSRTFDSDVLGPYNRNVSIISLLLAVVLLTVSMLLQHRIKIISNGVMLGGLFILVYSLGRGFASQDTKYTFIAATVALSVALVLGYLKFVKGPDQHSSK